MRYCLNLRYRLARTRPELLLRQPCRIDMVRGLRTGRKNRSADEVRQMPQKVCEETRNTFDHVLKGLLDDKNQIINRSGWEVSDRLTRTRSFRTDSFPAILPNRLFPYRAVSEGVLLSQ